MLLGEEEGREGKQRKTSFLWPALELPKTNFLSTEILVSLSLSFLFWGTEEERSSFELQNLTLLQVQVLGFQTEISDTYIRLSFCENPLPIFLPGQRHQKSLAIMLSVRTTFTSLLMWCGEMPPPSVRQDKLLDCLPKVFWMTTA